MRIILVLIILFLSLLSFSVLLFLFSLFYSIERGISISTIGFISSLIVGLTIIIYLITEFALQFKKDRKV